jgi:NAD(P)-dependent dehydrogenase (short-subunit alcohol dehydrogenase family)
MPPPDPAEHRAIVTGASSGIGKAIAERLLDDGWSVVGVSRSTPAIAHPRFHSVPLDLAAGDTVAAALSALSPATALVHAAGLLRVGRIGEQNPADGALMWRTHVDAAVRLVERLAPAMPDGGRIVLIGSRVASGAAGRAQYAASKAALLGLARSWAIELAPRGITVNVVAPGATDTAMLSDPARAGVTPKLPPIGRFVRPEEVAALTAFLLSDMAASITGQQITICGGASLERPET